MHAPFTHLGDILAFKVFACMRELRVTIGDSGLPCCVHVMSSRAN